MIDIPDKFDACAATEGPATEAMRFLRDLLIRLVQNSQPPDYDTRYYDRIDMITGPTMSLIAEMFMVDAEFMYWAMSESGAVHEDKSSARKVIASMKRHAEEYEDGSPEHAE